MSGNKNHWPNVSSYGHGIICRSCIAKKYLEVGSVQVVRIGTFVQVHSVREDNVLFCIVDEEMQVDSNQLVCKKADILYVPESLWGPLFTVQQCERLALVEDRKVAESMGNISVGHTVQVLGPDNESICTGNVTFKNSIARLGVGVFFGLQILKTSKECLQTIIKKVSLLEPGTKGFPRGCDVVVTVDKIRPCNVNFKEKSIYHFDRESQKLSAKSPTNGEDINNSSFKSMIVLNLKDKFSNNSKKSHINNANVETIPDHSGTKKIINSDNPLSVGDEVIYLDGDTPEKGIVRWMGNIKNSLKVGVEFDNPIGSGTGDVDGVELFKAKYAHALIVPPMALIKLSDYMMNNANETVQYKNNNNNNNNKNNNNYNNLNCNDFCCDGKQNNEEKYKSMFKSNSHQCLKHTERTFHCDDSLQHKGSGEGFFVSKHFCINDGQKSGGAFELLAQHNSKSFDFVNSCEKKTNYKRQCYSIDNALMQNKELRTHVNVQNSNIAVQKTPSQDLYDLMGSSWSKQDSTHNYSEEKNKKELDEEGLSLNKNISNHLNEENSKKDNERDICDSQYSEFSSSDESITNFYDTPKPSCTPYGPSELGKGSVVELIFKGEPHYGVIRWIGTLPDNGSPRLIAGIEMEEERSGFTDGTFNNKRYFHCNPKKALFIPLSKCRRDSRFLDESHRQSLSPRINYGQIDCPVVEGTIPPINRKGDIESLCGKNRGIQGHHNSCYLDATLFSMFAFTSVFDSLLYRPPTKQDIPQYSEVQRVLREEIVNPLRKNLYVRADRVMKLRTLLDKLSSVSGLTSEEKDPEEFLNSLLAQILKAEPFLKLSSGQEAFHYQLFVEKDERLTCPSVQQLFEQSFVTSDIKLKQVPSCLIIQMPRFGKSFKMYSRILPPQLLDVTDIIENSPRQCTVCGKSAEYECKECFGQNGIGNGLESISFCKTCLETAHNHYCRMRHNYRALTVPVEFLELQEHCIIPRLYMELFAVVCIETSHYVAFVKCGSGSDAPWCFFDSMADRKGEQNGYNIPEMVPCPDLPYWLSEDGAKMLNEMRDDRQLPEHAKRLFSDAYMCMYQSPDMMMYRFDGGRHGHPL